MTAFKVCSERLKEQRILRKKLLTNATTFATLLTATK